MQTARQTTVQNAFHNENGRTKAHENQSPQPVSIKTKESTEGKMQEVQENGNISTKAG